MESEIELYLRELTLTSASPATRSGYGIDLAQFRKFAAGRGVETVERLTRELATEWLASLQSGPKPLARATIARKAVALRTWFKFLVDRGYASGKLSVPRVKKDRRRLPHVLTIEQVKAMLDTCKPLSLMGLRDRAILELLYSTGCRSSEVCGLDLADVHYSEDGTAVAKVTGKGSKQRMVYLTPSAVASLKDYVERVRAPVDIPYHARALLLTREGTRITRKALRIMIRARAKLAGIDAPVTSHWLRHSFATHMLRGGASIRVIQSMLGHSDLSTTEIYTHVDNEDERAAHAGCHPKGDTPPSTAHVKGRFRPSARLTKPERAAAAESNESDAPGDWVDWIKSQGARPMKRTKGPRAAPLKGTGEEPPSFPRWAAGSLDFAEHAASSPLCMTRFEVRRIASYAASDTRRIKNYAATSNKRRDHHAANLRELAQRLGRRRTFTSRRSWSGGSALERVIIEANVAVPRPWFAAWKKLGWIEESFDSVAAVYRYTFTDAGREVVRVAA